MPRSVHPRTPEPPARRSWRGRAVAVLCALVPAAAWGQTLPTIAVTGLHQGDLSVTQQRRAAADLAAVVDDSGFFTSVGPRHLADALSGREAIVLQEAFLTPGRTLLDDGRTLYGQAHAADAVPVLEQAVTTLLAGMETATGTRDLWQANVYLGAARIATNDYPGARQAFEHAVALVPLRSPSPAAFPPALIERFEDIRRERVALSATVTLTAGDDNTLVWHNGEPVGAVPLTLERVVPGTHVFTAVSPLGFTAYQVVDVPESGAVDVALRLAAPRLAQTSRDPRGRSRQIAGLYRALGETLSADLWLVAGTVDQTATVQLYSPRTDTWSAAVEGPYTGVATDEIAALLPELFLSVHDDATFDRDQRARLPAALDVSGNALLSRVLVLPATDWFADERVREHQPMPRWAKAVLWGTVGAAVAGGAAWGTAWGLTDPFQGTITVRPTQ